MENNEEQKDRGHLRLASEQAKVNLPPIEKVIDGVMYNTRDSEVLLIGETGIGSAHYPGESPIGVPHKDLKQLWRTKDGHYFCYRVEGVKPIDVGIARKYMDKHPELCQYLTEAHRRELELDDEEETLVRDGLQSCNSRCVSSQARFSNFIILF